MKPEVHTTKKHRPLEVRSQVGYVDDTAVAGAGIIEAGERRDGKPALSGDDPIPLPAANQTVHPAAGAAAEAVSTPERQLIAEVRVELVLEAVSGDSLVQVAIVGTEKFGRLIFAFRRAVLETRRS